MSLTTWTAKVRARLEQIRAPLPEISPDACSIHFGGPSKFKREVEARVDAEQTRERLLEELPTDLALALEMLSVACEALELINHPQMFPSGPAYGAIQAAAVAQQRIAAIAARGVGE